jgi:hypothetical protein
LSLFKNLIKIFYEYSTEKQEEEKKMTNGHQENLLEECSDLLCEELEINKDLISLLKSEKLVEDNIQEEIDKQGSRSKKIRFLLKKIGSHGMKGLVFVQLTLVVFFCCLICYVILNYLMFFCLKRWILEYEVLGFI